jgi:hypothetical protein
MNKPQVIVSNLKTLILGKIKQFITKLLTSATWRKKRTWIYFILCLRLLYVAMNEYGLNPRKKQLKGDHVFLTGAGNGLGRLMAIKLGKMGCKLSLSDINLESLQETKTLCEKAGISIKNITTFECDMAKRDSIAKGA